MTDQIRTVADEPVVIPPLVIRAVSLALAVWSHGPKAGKDSDRCFPARARVFARYLDGDAEADDD